jgi:5-methylcytosine-specific restriction endonuclease McrA
VSNAHPAWHSWYDTARWQRLRAYQLLEHPLCAICARKGLVEPASVVDHVDPHRGDWMKFCTGKLQSLCKTCHDGEKRTIEIRGYSTEIGIDGWPVDPEHPAYHRRQAVK